MFCKNRHCVKSAPILSFFWYVFSRIQTERYEISLRIQSECGKIRTRKNSVFGHFSRSEITIFAKRSISDVWLTTWLGSECSSAFTSSDDNCSIISLKKEYLQNRILNKTKNKTKHNNYIRVKNNPISNLCIFVFILWYRIFPIFSRSSRSQMFLKIGVFKNFLKPMLESLFNKDSNTGVFMWILQNL